MLNRLISVSERVTPSSSQMRWARAVWADPENTTTSRMTAAYPQPAGASAARSSSASSHRCWRPTAGAAPGMKAKPCGTLR